MDGQGQSESERQRQRQGEGETDTERQNKKVKEDIFCSFSVLITVCLGPTITDLQAATFRCSPSGVNLVHRNGLLSSKAQTAIKHTKESINRPSFIWPRERTELRRSVCVA